MSHLLNFIFILFCDEQNKLSETKLKEVYLFLYCADVFSLSVYILA